MRKTRFILASAFLATVLIFSSCDFVNRHRETEDSANLLERETDMAGMMQKDQDSVEQDIAKSVYAIFVDVYTRYNNDPDANLNDFTGYWTKSLREFYENEVEMLDADPWLDAQDMEEPKYEGVDILSVEGDTAKVYVRMVDFGHRRIIPCTLVRENEYWLIDDMSNIRKSQVTTE